MDQLPLFVPESGWVAHSGPLPRPTATTISIDVETKDTNLNTRGPGWAYQDGYVLGVAMAWPGGAVYAPLRHPQTENRGQDEVMAWVEFLLANNTVYFHNMAYDMGWLRAAGCTVWPADAHDTYAMAVLLDENRDSYSLDACCAWQGVKGKDERLLREAAAAYGVDPKSGMWKMPAAHVGAYAEQDVVATLALATKLIPQLQAENLTTAYNTEMRLVRVVHEMRKRGIRVDESAAEQAQGVLRTRLKGVLGQIRCNNGRVATMADMRSPNALAAIFDAEGVPYPRTAKTGQPSFQAQWLEHHTHWLPGLVRQARKLDDMAEKFIGSYILEFNHRGRIHAEVHQLRDETGGTRSYRFSYSSPPLQQMPSRDEDLAPLIRRIFLPEQGQHWFAPDYSQQEYRLAVHYAYLSNQDRAQQAVDYYRNNPDADFHKMVAELTGLKRKDAKQINFGILYGMGVDKLALSLGVNLDEAHSILEQYHREVPWVKGLMNYCSRMAQSRGYIRLLDGARCRFALWQPARGERGMALGQAAAKAKWPGRNLERAFTHKALNRCLQGGAARQTKQAMVQCWEEHGYLPLIQMHDELAFSFDDPRHGTIAADCMRNVVKLEIPVRVDEEWGASWGTATQTWEQFTNA